VDVMAMVGAIEGIHNCTVTVEITTGGQGHNGLCNIRLTARFAVLPGSDLPKEVCCTGKWPSAQAKSFYGLVYNLAWQLDYAIQKAYEQMTYSGTQPISG